ncbi:MAG: DUF4974 domain-containing protein [Bacteroides sp.]|nr:DUF4974 domain-containing protein [Bacteroides sp.]
MADAPVEQVQNYVQTIQSYPALKMKNEDGILHYEVKSPPVKDDREMMYHSLKVPRSGQYQLVLSDGTHVFLNSETELKYPIFFTDNDSVREVHLKGEAYFKVAHNPKSSFIVHTRRGKIKVLGTSFNIQDYADEERTTVTLQEGHIACFFSGGEYEMYPGNQLWLDGDGMDNVPWVVQQADVASAVSWVSGVFEFNDMPLLQIMKQLARWYDIEYTFERMALKEHRFTGVAYRNLPLEKLLDQIEKTTDIHFKIKKRNVTIY